MGDRSSVLVPELENEFKKRVAPLLKQAPWLLRVTEHRGRPVPVLIVKQRIAPNSQYDTAETSNVVLQERGLVYGHALRRCLPVIRDIVRGICDLSGVPLELHRFLQGERITFRGNLPLDEEAGSKIALIFKLQERVRDMDRVELIVRRVERFSREEAAYWLTRATHYGDTVNRWAQTGMRIMLGGQPGDKAVLQQLEKLRK